jgi:hypothetical protein
VLVEVQLGSLAALRNKVRALLDDGHRVRIVKPLIAEKRLIRLDAPDGQIVSDRKSPKRETLIDLFQELVYFTKVFPHRRLELEIPLIDMEETRYPGHGRRRRWRENDFIVADQRLLAVREVQTIKRAVDLLRLLPAVPPQQFDTGVLAESLQVRRNVAQRVAYCLRECGAAKVVAKSGNAWVYRLTRRPRRAA